MNQNDALQLLRSATGLPDATFHPGQWEAIDGLVNRREKLLVVQRTGWGKSAVYFLATHILRSRGEGPTLIVSPLLALMRNQLASAARIGIRAETINKYNRSDWDQVYEAVHRGNVDTLLISPERLAIPEFSDDFLPSVAESISLLVVDEAHCISDWGHDFRPDYKRLLNIIRQLPNNTPLLATTATASSRVVEDIEEQIGGLSTIRGSLARESLCLENLKLPEPAQRLAWLGQHIPAFRGTGIVYTLTTNDADRVADYLRQRGIAANAYHSRIRSPIFENSDAYRHHLEDSFLRNELKVLVATSALGMGYDKSDVAFVVHYQMPASVVDYYQQVGRAGRAIPRAIGILMSGEEDTEILDYFRRTAFPSKADINTVLRALKAKDGLSVSQLERSTNLRKKSIESVLRFLDVQNPAPVVRMDGLWHRTPVQWEMPYETVERLTRRRESELIQMQSYVDETGCLMAFLRGALDDGDDRPCGRCSNCRGTQLAPASVDAVELACALRFLKRSEQPIKPRTSAPTGVFAGYGISTFSKNLRLETGRVLSRWGDAGWGAMVADDKHAGEFRNELVEAVADMILERWKPDPAPQWVACVPSRRRPQLVPDFARRLAERLGLPFVEAVGKVRDNEAQKGQQNTYHQCKNLDGAFAIDTNISDSPVLLVDDIVDSRWTLCLIGALLRRAGSGPVFPLALASTAHNG